MDTDDIARAVLQQLEDAWNAGDGIAYGAPYTDDASFVTIRGDLIRQAPAIAAGHAGIFATTHAGSTNRMKLLGAQRIGDDVIIAVSCNTLDAPQGPLAGVHQAMSTSVLLRSDGQWRVAATHNTLVADLPPR
jgi:uncharacterized protein (TIGR02246 family)